MPNLDAILALQSPEYEVSYSARDALLHALASGFCADPLNESELPFVYEGRDQRVSPAFASGLGKVGVLVRETPGTGLANSGSMHAEIRIALHRPLPPQQQMLVDERVVEVVDKGAGRGLLIHLQRTLCSKATREQLVTTIWSSYYPTDGGIGGSAGSRFSAHPLPEREPEHVDTRTTSANQALFFRLVLGDTNPLHADPRASRAAGFERPLLHGLCTFGFACRAVLAAYCDYRPERIASLDARFSAPLYPGESIITEMWRDGAIISFRCRSPERGVLALNNGRVVLRET